MPQSARRDAEGRVLWTGDRSIRRQMQFHDQMPAGCQNLGEVRDQAQIDVVDDRDQIERARHTVASIEIAPDPLRG